MQLRTFLETGEMSRALLTRIEAAADGNFLWAEQFCLSVRSGRLSPASIAEALPRMRGLEELYREFWNRVMTGLAPETESRLWRVAGVLSVARTALTTEQICRFVGLGDDQFIVLRPIMQQYLDEVELPNERDPDTPLLGFRIYHASFRDCLLCQPGLVPKQHHERIVRAYLPAERGRWECGERDYREWDRYGLSFVPYHAIQAGLWDEVESLLTDIFFLEAKTRAGMVFELAADFTAAVQALPEDCAQYRILRLLEEALRRDIHFIARHAQDYSQGLFQCLWNSCWWYDCPEAAQHYFASRDCGRGAGGEGSLNQGGRRPAPWQQRGPKLHALLECWRHQKEEADPGFSWFRCHRPPGVHLGTAQLAVLRGHESGVHGVAFSPDENRIVSGSFDHTVRVWDARSGVELADLRGHTAAVTSVAFSPSGDRVVSGSDDKTIRVWDARSGAEMVVLYGHTNRVTSVAFSPDGDCIVSGSQDQTVRVWDASSGAELAIFRGHENFVESVAFSPGGNQIASGSRDQTVRVWDVRSSVAHAVLRGHKSGVSSVAFSLGGDRIVSGSQDQTVRVWDARNGTELVVLRGHRDRVCSVAFSPGGDYIVSGSRDKTVRVWGVRSGTEMAVLRGHEWYVRSVAFSLRGNRIVSGSDDKTLRVWDARNDTELAVLRGHESWAKSVTFSSSGDQVLSGSRDKTLRVWDARSGVELTVLRGHESSVTSVAFSPGGERIASGSKDGTVRVWDAHSGAVLVVLRGHEKGVRSVAFSPGGDRIVSGSYDDSVRVWDARRGAELTVLRGHESSVWSVAFSPSGDRIVSGSYDQTVRVWDARSGVELAVLRGHEMCVQGVAFSPGGDRIVSGSSDQTVRVWDARSGHCLEVIQGCGDVQAIAAGSQAFPLRALARGWETVVQQADSGKPVAWFPVGISHIVTNPSGRTWAGTDYNYICLMTLEGTIELPAKGVSPQ